MQRQNWPDIAKGIAIILVVYGHAVRGLVAGGQIEFADNGWAFFDYLIYTVHMPVFFVISGYFFDQSYAKGAAHFARDRLMTVVWPYFLWSVLHLAAQYLGSQLNLVNTVVDASRFVQILWDPVSPFWFLYALAAALIVSALLRPLNPLLIAAACVAAMLILSRTPHLQVVDDIVYGLAYFSLGRAVRRQNWLPLPATLPVALSALVFIGCVIAGFRANIEMRLDIPAALAGLVLVYQIALRLPPSSKAAAMLNALGRYSMGIFVMHVTVIVAVRAICLKFVTQDPFLIVALQTLTGLAVPMLVQYAANRLGIGRLLGLQVSLPATNAEKAPKPAADGLAT